MKLIEILDQQNLSFEMNEENLTVGGYLDLRSTAISQLPENLTVGGSLDLRSTAIENVFSKDNCGSSGRTIYALYNEPKGGACIVAGCFFGTHKTFIAAVKEKYGDTNAAEKYLSDAEGLIHSLQAAR